MSRRKKRVVHCEGDSELTIACRNGQTIDVFAASYGMRELQTCQHNYQNTADVGCVNAQSTRIIKTTCQGKQKCVIMPTKDVYGDPCVGTSKYLEIYYRCRVAGKVLFQSKLHWSVSETFLVIGWKKRVQSLSL